MPLPVVTAYFDCPIIRYYMYPKVLYSDNSDSFYIPRIGRPRCNLFWRCAKPVPLHIQDTAALAFPSGAEYRPAWHVGHQSRCPRAMCGGFCGVWNYRHFAENRTFLLRVYSDSILRVCFDSILRVCFGSIGCLGFLGLQAVLQCRFNILNMFLLDILTDLRHGVEDFVYTVDLLCSQRLMVLCYTGHAPQ